MSHFHGEAKWSYTQVKKLYCLVLILSSLQNVSHLITKSVSPGSKVESKNIC